ncbi:hypothetical protein VP01_811g6 [Puccinia sorghi]|uniref:Thioredoxin domain-containing protein n=1 Tax=Puccinia sorghi TaxID=27349 RepID=A0A0L6UCB7_9BASI|nr:hypothetical protein VP01_811g6 [Puccinia sorghi]
MASDVVTVNHKLHAGQQLNEENFDANTHNGLWLVDKMKHYEPVGLKMGQVDCIAQGDLCIRLNVDYYPQIKLFEDGKFIESYNGDKDVEAIANYLEQKADAYQSKHKSSLQPAPTSSESAAPEHSPSSSVTTQVAQIPPHQALPTPSPQTYPYDQPVPQAHPPPASEHLVSTIHTDASTTSLPNPTGDVLTLDKDNWHSYTNPSINPHPIFIQFQTAWCKECRTLTPVWEEVARLLKNEVNVAVLDCEAKRNEETCQVEHISQFPSFVIYHDGTKLAYSGLKVTSVMAEFVRKIVTTPGSHEISVREFEEMLMKKNLFFLLLHSSQTPISVIKAVETVGKGFLGSAVILKSDSQTIYERLELSKLHAYLLVFKESEPRPWAKLTLEEQGVQEEPSAVMRQRKLSMAIQHWITLHSIPILAELDQHNFHRLFNSGAKKLIVLACLRGVVATTNGVDLEKSNAKSLQLRDEMNIWATQWRKSQQARSVDIPIDWVWVNAEVWADWLYKSYGINLPRPTEDPRESSAIIIVDPHNHLWFDSQENGLDIAFRPTSLFQTLLAIEMGKLSGKLSGSFASRLTWRFHRITHSIGVIVGAGGYWVKRKGWWGRGVGAGYGGHFSMTISSSSCGSSSCDPSSSALTKPAFATVFGLNSNVPLKAD